MWDNVSVPMSVGAQFAGERGICRSRQEKIDYVSPDSCLVFEGCYGGLTT